MDDNIIVWLSRSMHELVEKIDRENNIWLCDSEVNESSCEVTVKARIKQEITGNVYEFEVFHRSWSRGLRDGHS